MVIDSNIVIGYLNDAPICVEIIDTAIQGGVSLFISVVTLTEVLSLPEATPSELNKIKEFLSNFVVISYDENIAEIAAVVRRKYKLKLPDSVIAATAIKLGRPLVSFDRVFEKVSSLRLFKI